MLKIIVGFVVGFVVGFAVPILMMFHGMEHL